MTRLGASELKDIAREYVRTEYDADDYSSANVEVEDMRPAEDVMLVEVAGRFKNGLLGGDRVRVVLTVDNENGTVLAESDGRLDDLGSSNDPIENLSELGDAWKTTKNVMGGDILTNPKCPRSSCGSRNVEEMSDGTYQCINCGKRFTDDGTGVDIF